jgi:hypothetical protein
MNILYTLFMNVPRTEDSLEQSFKPFLEDFYRSRGCWVPEREMGISRLRQPEKYPSSVTLARE